MSKQQELRIRFIALSISGLFFGGLAFTVAHPQLYEKDADSASKTFTNVSAAPPATSTTRGPVQNVRFTAYDAGIYPRRLRANPGVVALVLEDRTGRHPVLVIERETVGADLPVAVASIRLNQPRTRTEFTLDVGNYRVFDTSNRANQAELIIEQ